MQKNSTFLLFPLLLVFYEIAVYLSNDAFAPAMPNIARDLVTSHDLVQLSFTVWFAGGLLVQFIIGPLSDRYGRRPVLLIGGILFVIATLLCTIATNIQTLLIARFLQGMAIPTMIIPGYAAVNEVLDRNTAIRTLARMQSITILAPAFGPLLGSFILLFHDWRWILGLLFIWSAIAVTLLYIKMPETLSNEDRSKKMNLSDISSQYYQVISNNKFMKNILANGFLGGGMVAWILAGPFLVVNQFHYNVIYVGLFQLIIFGCFIIGTTVIKKKMNDDNIHRFISVGLNTSLFGTVLSIVLAYLFPQLLMGLIVSFMLLTFGAGLCFPILSRLAIEASDAPMGIRMTVLSSTLMLVATISSATLSFVYSGTLLSLATIVFSFSLIAFMLRGIDYSKNDVLRVSNSSN